MIVRYLTMFLLQNQELLIKTIEDQEKNREETRVFQDQVYLLQSWSTSPSRPWTFIISCNFPFISKNIEYTDWPVWGSKWSTALQIMSMKQDNQALAMSIALKSQTSESTKKKPFYKALFKSKKAKVSFYFLVPHFPEICVFFLQNSVWFLVCFLKY